MLYISQEIEPYLAPTPLSTFGRKLPVGIQECGVEVRTFAPKYGIINERRNQLHEVIRLSGLNIDIDDSDHPLVIKVATLQPSRLQVYFIDNDDYFTKSNDGLLETVSHPEDNDERSMFFVRGTAETVKKLRWEPNVVHCIGWITALTPLYLKTIYADDPVFRNAKIVYSLFGGDVAGEFDARMAEKIQHDGVPAERLSALTADGAIDTMKLNKLAIDYADAIVASSEDVPQALIDYAKASGKPFLEYPGEDNVEAYRDFYINL